VSTSYFTHYFGLEGLDSFNIGGFGRLPYFYFVCLHGLDYTVVLEGLKSLYLFLAIIKIVFVQTRIQGGFLFQILSTGRDPLVKRSPSLLSVPRIIFKVLKNEVIH
jgi:hypothetical protein